MKALKNYTVRRRLVEYYYVQGATSAKHAKEIASQKGDPFKIIIIGETATRQFN